MDIYGNKNELERVCNVVKILGNEEGEALNRDICAKMTHVRNSAAHICTMYWWETNGAQRNSRNTTSGTTIEHYYSFMIVVRTGKKRKLWCEQSPSCLHSLTPLTSNASWTMSDQQRNLIFCIFSLILWLTRTSAGRTALDGHKTTFSKAKKKDFLIIKNWNLKSPECCCISKPLLVLLRYSCISFVTSSFF